MIYEPDDDSYLLAKEVKKYAKGLVLDIGTGSGIQAFTASQQKGVRFVVGVDVDSEAVSYCRKKYGVGGSGGGNEEGEGVGSEGNVKNLAFFESDLFSFFDALKVVGGKKSSGVGKVALGIDEGLSGKSVGFLDLKKKIFGAKNVGGGFDTVIFNPPYLPNERGVEDIALFGGKHGYEVIERFLRGVGGYLKPKGKVLLLFSSLSKKDVVERILREELFDFTCLSKKHIFFEDLYVYLIEKKEIRRLVERKVLDVEYLTHGKRGCIHVGKFIGGGNGSGGVGSRKRGVKVAVKTKFSLSHAKERIGNEGKWLAKLNKKKIGPKVLFSNRNMLIYEFVEGEFLVDYVEAVGKKETLRVVREVFDQCYAMDKLKVDKEEMHRPVKHILVQDNGRVVMLDFERCHSTKKPKNVTQFAQFLVSGRISEFLLEKGILFDEIKVRELSAVYKKSYSKKDYEKLVSCFG